MVKEKYPDLDFSDINFSDMKGHDSVNPPRLVQAPLVHPTEKDGILTVERVVEAEGVQAEVVVGENNIENVVFVPSD